MDGIIAYYKARASAPFKYVYHEYSCVEALAARASLRTPAPADEDEVVYAPNAHGYPTLEPSAGGSRRSGTHRPYPTHAAPGFEIERPLTAPGFRPMPPNAVDPRLLQNQRSHTPGPTRPGRSHHAYQAPPPMPPLPPMPLGRGGPYTEGSYPQPSAALSVDPSLLQPGPARPVARSRSSRNRSGNFIINTPDSMPGASGSAGAQPQDDSCPVCLNPAPTSWRFGNISQRMVCQPCSLYERRTGKQRSPEIEAKKVLRTLAGAKR
uniref:GATA-type domain-containing protein n=1 Tax=Mycena chlorophos TaxID=658473 RepID=A0ABQ0LXD6_MYCCL|nr:predicted protein [Mycena chlorophos]